MVGRGHLMVFIVLLLFKGYLAAEPTIVVSPPVVIANPGETISAVCTAIQDGRVLTKLESCRFRVSGTSYTLKPGKTAYNGISYHGNGWENGECGIQIQNIGSPHNQNITCSIALENGPPIDLEGHVQIIVAMPPTKINMTVNGEPTSSSQSQPRVFKAGDQVTATCGISKSRPISNITWHLGNDTLTENVQDPIEHCNVDSGDICSIEQKLTFTVKETDDKKILSCTADHYALKGSQLLAKFRITVNYPPKPQVPIEKFGLVIGQSARISVLIDANPRPTVSWKIGELLIYENSLSHQNKVQPTVMDSETGLWESTLLLDTLTKEDTEKTYTVIAHNELGEAHYNVILSTSLEPKVLEMPGYLVALIVIVVVIVLLLIAGGLYSRSRGIHCCAARDSRGHTGESSDTESTEPTADKPKMTFISVFKKKNEKVAGDKEILQTIETNPSSERKNSAENLVYAELDLGAHSPGPTVVVRGDDDKTEYAEIIHTQPPSK